MKTLNFQTIIKSTKKKSATVLMSALTMTAVFSSCSKEADIASDFKPAPPNKIASLPTGTTPIDIGNGASGTITKLSNTIGGGFLFTNYFVDQGIFTHPDSIYHKPNGSYYLKLSTGDNKVGTPPSDYDLEFTGTGNGYIKVKSGVTLKVLDGISYKDVKTANIATATSFTIGEGGFGHDNVVRDKSKEDASTNDKKGWFNYNITNHEVVPITNRILLFTVGTSTYAFEFLSVYKNQTPTAISPSTFPNNYSNLNFRFKIL